MIFVFAREVEGLLNHTTVILATIEHGNVSLEVTLIRLTALLDAAHIFARSRNSVLEVGIGVKSGFVFVQELLSG